MTFLSLPLLVRYANGRYFFEIPDRGGETITVYEVTDEMLGWIRIAHNPSWQPIESAPKDQNILLWGKYWRDEQGFFKEPMIGRWNERDKRWELIWNAWIGIRPTQWMPLPSNPLL